VFFFFLTSFPSLYNHYEDGSLKSVTDMKGYQKIAIAFNGGTSEHWNDPSKVSFAGAALFAPCASYVPARATFNALLVDDIFTFFQVFFCVVPLMTREFSHTCHRSPTTCSPTGSTCC
jgi:hypothetical protein